MLNRLTLTVRRGASAQIPIRIETPGKVFVPITAMQRTAPINITALAVQVPLEDLFDLYTQKRAMKKYAKVLGKRIAKFSDD